MTTVSIIGTGTMARAIATRALMGGADVQLLARDDEKKAIELAEELAETISAGTVGAGVVGDAPMGDIVVLAVPYSAAAGLVRSYGDLLVGKVILDITNPINAAYDGLLTSPGTSAAEEIDAVAPVGAPVVKGFNTTFASTVEAGQAGGEPLDIFVAGDDPVAKGQVFALIEAGRMRAIDVGPLARARTLEGLALMHIGLQGLRGTTFNTAFKLVG